MDMETLLTGTKWEILKLLSEKKLSPSEIAKILNTTIANISQQMRLLQTAGIVKKEKTSAVKAGKPRTLFSLSHDYAMIIVFSKGFAEKKLIKITKEQKNQFRRLMKKL